MMTVLLRRKIFQIQGLEKKIISRAGWSESSKAIARAGDDYLRLGEFPNLEDKNIEWWFFRSLPLIHRDDDHYQQYKHP